MEESNHVKKKWDALSLHLQRLLQLGQISAKMTNAYNMYSLNRLIISKKCKNTEQQEKYKIYVLFYKGVH